MKEFKFLIFVIVLLELTLFVCGFMVVDNRHNARGLFIELEREQQIHHSLRDEEARLRLEVSTLEQSRQIETKAKEKGLAPVTNEQVVILEHGSSEHKGGGR